MTFGHKDPRWRQPSIKPDMIRGLDAIIQIVLIAGTNGDFDNIFSRGRKSPGQRKFRKATPKDCWKAVDWLQRMVEWHDEKWETEIEALQAPPHPKSPPFPRAIMKMPRFPFYVIYKHMAPCPCPDGSYTYVVRGWNLVSGQALPDRDPSGMVYTLEAAREIVERKLNRGLPNARVEPRDPIDDRSIVETWT